MPVRTGPEFLVNTTTTGDQGYPSTADYADGRFIIVFESNNEVRGQIFDANGARSGSEFSTGASQELPSIARLFDGRFVLAWDEPADMRKGRQDMPPLFLKANLSR